MSKYLDETLQWRLSKKEEKSGDVDYFVQEIIGGPGSRRNGTGARAVFAGKRNMRLAPQGLGCSNYYQFQL